MTPTCILSHTLSSPRLVPLEDALDALSSDVQMFVTFILLDSNLSSLWSCMQNAIHRSIQIVILNQQDLGGQAPAEGVLNTETILHFVSTSVQDHLGTVDSCNMASFLVELSRHLTSNATRQCSLLSTLVKCIKPPTVVQNKNQTTTASHVHTEWATGMLSSDSMLQSWSNSLGVMASSLAHTSELIVLFLTYLSSVELPFMPKSTKDFITNVVLPQSASYLTTWTTLAWLSTQRSVFADVPTSGGPNPMENNCTSICMGETLLSSLVREKLPEVYAGIANDADEDHMTERDGDEYGDFHEPIQAALLRLQSYTSSKPYVTDTTQLLVAIGHHLVSAICATNLSDEKENITEMMRFLKSTRQYEPLLFLMHNTSSSCIERTNGNERTVSSEWKHSTMLAQGALSMASRMLSQNFIKIAEYNMKRAITFFLQMDTVKEETVDEYIHILNALKQHPALQNSTGRACILRYAFEVTHILSSSRTGDGSNSEKQQLHFLWLNVFKYAVECHDLSLARQTLSQLQNGGIGQIQRLVVAYVEAGNIQGIVSTHWGDALESQVISDLEWQARNSDVIALAVSYAAPLTNQNVERTASSSISYYHILYAFFLARQRPGKAAQTMFELQSRLKQEMNAVEEDQVIHILQYRRVVLSSVLTTLSLLPKEDRWVLSSSKKSGNQMNKSMQIIRLPLLRQELCCLTARSTLAKSKTIPIATCVSPSLGVLELVQLLVSMDAIDLAVSLVTLFDLDLSSILLVLAAQEPLPSCRLQTLCTRFDSGATNFKYHVLVARVLLEQNAQRCLPLWLVAAMMGTSSSPVSSSTVNQQVSCGFAKSESNPVALIRLYMEFGCLEEACRLFLRNLPKDIPIMSYSHHNRTEWLPYTLLDTFFTQVEKQSSVEKGQSHLQEQADELRRHLVAYRKVLDLAYMATRAQSMVQ